jgi:3-dehydroquinate synthase
MTHDKKVAGGRVRLILPESAGRVAIVDDVPSEAVEAAWEAVRV